MSLAQYITGAQPVKREKTPHQADVFGYSYQDLYPWCPADSKLWLELFIIADKHDKNLAHALQYIRSVGAALILDRQWGFCIQPIIDPEGVNGWATVEQYLRERNTYLAPYSQVVIDALKKLRDKVNKNQIL